METCNNDAAAALHSLEKQIFSLSLVVSGLMATCVVVTAIAAAIFISQRRRRTGTTKRCPILQAPTEDCSIERGSLVICENHLVLRDYSVTVAPVQQTSTDKGEQVI